MKKSKMVALVAVAALATGVSALGASSIYAQTATTTPTNPMSKLVSALATKFNLNSADVQSVVDETMAAERAEREAQHAQEEATRLAQAVTDGKLTQAQADLIKAKTAELKSTMEANRTAVQSLTMEQRKAKMDAQQTELKAWATANNIPVEYLHFIGGGKGHGGRGMGGPRMDGVAPTPASTTSTTVQSSS